MAKIYNTPKRTHIVKPVWTMKNTPNFSAAWSFTK